MPLSECGFLILLMSSKYYCVCHMGFVLCREYSVYMYILSRVHQCNAGCADVWCMIMVGQYYSSPCYASA